MEELKKFREFLSEGKFKQGDMVRLKDDGGVGDKFAVISTRRMFGSNIEAVRVTDKEGKTTEYDETQLVMSMDEGILNESAPGYDTRKSGEALPTLETVQAAYEAKQENLKEGVWNMPSADEVMEFVAYMEDAKEKFYHIGSDAVHDGLEQAIISAKNLITDYNE